MLNNMKKGLIRAAMLLLLGASTTTARADEWPEYVTDVVLMGCYSDYSTEAEINYSLRYYLHEGYTFIQDDLNKNAGGLYIYLGYRKGDHASADGGYVTGFVVVNTANPEDTFIYNYRTYHLCPYKGDPDFLGNGGNLNTGNVGWNLYLYYTTDEFADKRVVTDISFNSTRDGSVNCYKEKEGEWEDGIDFNRGNLGTSIYMHVSTVTKTNRPESDPEMRGGLKYNGKQQELVKKGGTLASGSMMFRVGTTGEFTSDLSEVTAKDAGYYPVYYYASESEHGDQSEIHSQTAVINKGPNNGATVSCGATLEQATPSPTLTGNLSVGPVTYIYSSSQDGEYSANNPSFEGTWWVKAVIEGDSNNDPYTTAPASFTVTHDYALHNSGTTEDDAYVISTVHDLKLLAQRVNSGLSQEDRFFKLSGNITFNGAENNFGMIGALGHSFSGVFDGCNFSVSGIRVSAPDGSYAGLFGYVGSDGVVKNLKLNNSTFSGSGCVGAIAGYNKGLINNCGVNGDVTVSAGYDSDGSFGGIAGNNTGSITSCRSNASVRSNNHSADMYFGGIAGNNTGTIRYSLYAGNTISANAVKGAIAGNSSGTLACNYYNSINLGGVNGSDCNGARKALTIGSHYRVSFTPTGSATVSQSTGVTTYEGNNGMRYDNQFFAGAFEAVDLSISCEQYYGFIFDGYNDGNGHELILVSDNVYTLNMTDEAPFIKVTEIAIVTSETTTMNHPYYIVTQDVTINSRITISGNVKLILSEGTTLNAKKGIGVESGNALTIEGGGVLYAKGSSYNAGIGSTSYGDQGESEHGTITINGGIIIAQGGYLAAGIGGGLHNKIGETSIITINGGVITSYAGEGGASGIGGGYARARSQELTEKYGQPGVIVINGGQVKAWGYPAGIGKGQYASANTNGSLTLGWTSMDDYIYSRVYTMEVAFAEGKYFRLDGGNVLATTSNIAEVKIVPAIPTDMAYSTVSGVKNYYLKGSSLSYAVTSFLGAELVEGVDYTTQLVLNNSVPISKTDGVYKMAEEGSYLLTITAKEGSGYTGSQSVPVNVYEYTIMSTETTKLYNRYCVVMNDVTVDHRIYIDGNVTLILEENATLRALEGIGVPDSSSLTIEGKGALIATTTGFDACIGGSGQGSINGDITIKSGQITTSGIVGIGCVNHWGSSGTVNLGWTNMTDFLYINKILCQTVRLNGHEFCDERGNRIGNVDALVGKKVFPAIPNDLSYAFINGINEHYLYTGDPIDISYAVKSFKGSSLTEGTHYISELINSSNEWISKTDGVYKVTDKDTYTLRITAMDNNGYKGSKEKSFSVIEYIPITSQTTTLDNFVYKVTENTTVSERIKVKGDVKLILGDGATLTASAGIDVLSPNSLTIEGPGTLNATAGTYSAAIGGTSATQSGSSIHGRITINGGIINATGGDYGAGIGGSNNSQVDENTVITINGGVVNATGGQSAAGIGSGKDMKSYLFGNAGTVIINGGRITARAGAGACGVGGHHSGSLSLGWTNPDDFIDADSYKADDIRIADGKVFTDGIDLYSWGTPALTLKSLTGKTLQPLLVPLLTFEDDGDNAGVISSHHGDDVAATLGGRKLLRNGFWNTLCLPFAVNDNDNSDTLTFSNTPLEGARVKTLTSTAYANGTLTMNFSDDLTSIEAGKPYIVRWDLNGSISNSSIIDPSQDVVTALNFIKMIPTVDNGQSTNWKSEEDYGSLVDGDTTTKYGLSKETPWVEFHYESPITPKGYALWTANDFQGQRNPTSWTIKAKNIGDAEWTVLVTVDNSKKDKLPMADSVRTVFGLANNTAYQYFRFEATRGDEFQLAELEFCTEQPEIPLSMVDPIFLATIDNTISNVETQYVDFVGSYDPVEIAGEDRSMLCVGAGNKLFYPNTAMIINAFRAYFRLKGVSASGNSANFAPIRSIRLNMGDQTTEVLLVPDDSVDSSMKLGWYDLSGHKLDEEPTEGGLYIYNGQVVFMNK